MFIRLGVELLKSRQILTMDNFKTFSKCCKLAEMIELVPLVIYLIVY